MEKLLVGIHTSLAFMTGRAELLLDTEDKTAFNGLSEAEFLAKSITDVSAHYKVEWLDQKSIDWANLIQCLLIVYGGRLFAIRAARRPAPRPLNPAAPAVRPGPPASVHRTPPPVNSFNGEVSVFPNGENRGVDSEALRTGEVAGVGQVQFPDDHPLMGGRKH